MTEGKDKVAQRRKGFPLAPHYVLTLNQSPHLRVADEGSGSYGVGFRVKGFSAVRQVAWFPERAEWLAVVCARAARTIPGITS